jgi:hypothetical protein
MTHKKVKSDAKVLLSSAGRAGNASHAEALGCVLHFFDLKNIVLF